MGMEISGMSKAWDMMSMGATAQASPMASGEPSEAPKVSKPTDSVQKSAEMQGGMEMGSAGPMLQGLSQTYGMM